MQTQIEKEVQMKRFHVHVSVNDLQQNIRFYSSIFGVQPAVTKDDYAKWMLDDPRINFAISTRGHGAGVNHLGIQVDSDAELQSMKVNLVAAQAPVLEQKEASCCYAKSDKYWVTDPQGVAWETFRSLTSVPVYGDDSGAKAVGDGRQAGACCVPATQS
jgi:catechol 2,3-dioxygenase-like lactoylglutathione lyase family enzyme